jgi:uncharacterized protein
MRSQVQERSGVDPGAPLAEDAPRHEIVTTPVTILADGQPLAVTTHVLRGARPGPTVGIVSGLHGDEISTAELVLSLLPLLPPASIAGTVLLIPMASPPTFAAGTRSTPHDMANLNRVFPGNPRGTVTELLAHALFSDVLGGCDVVIDLHAEPDAMAIRCLYTPPPRDDYGRKAFALARASGCPILYLTDGLPGMLTTAARARGVLAVMLETGGPLPGPHGLLPEAQGEILNMLRALGTIPGDPEPAAQVVVDAIVRGRRRSAGDDRLRLYRGDAGGGASAVPGIVADDGARPALAGPPRRSALHHRPCTRPVIVS